MSKAQLTVTKKKNLTVCSTLWLEMFPAIKNKYKIKFTVTIKTQCNHVTGKVPYQINAMSLKQVNNSATTHNEKWNFQCYSWRW